MIHTNYNSNFHTNTNAFFPFIIMHDYDLVEGIVASLLFPIFIYFFNIYEGLSIYYATMFGWFFTWFFRKLSVNMFLYYKHNFV
jgi:hypothetical protein